MNPFFDKKLNVAIAAIKAAPLEGELAEDWQPVDLKEFTLEELERLFTEAFGEKAFRAKQVFQWLYVHLARDFDEMTNLSKDLRTRLRRFARVSPLAPKASHPADDGTTKHTFYCDDQSVIESVLIPFDTHNSLCISSQIGCAMGCTFCFTAKMGLHRHLTTAEIVEQVVQARRIAGERDETISNIVFMGMGEPFHNVDHVLQACRILTDARGLDFSRRKVTVSTSGIVPAIERFAEESDVQLAVSLNATTDKTRSMIMPVNDRWDLEALTNCLRNLDLQKRQRITFEYVLLKDINDTLEDAQRIIDLTQGIPSKINLIPFNPHPDSPFDIPSEETMDRFQRYLIDRNMSCFRRRTRGRDAMAACGQLGKPGDKQPPHLRKRLEVLHDQRREREMVE